ncbi:eukaryotic translation initiation factor 5-like [Hylaeus volcanicus]|uniref:eukaryotic translation initiation factor 5-like n=1 Tax=Hylaeus volcanicus TaxID=313075 RepID=UPI0023B83C2D|nr:eukaryotic translation initiation factor 5-like [Hylaeus volcanicus]
MLSIPSYKKDDPNYRYKMPRLVAKVEGRGNGIRTNIVNMADIARALKRPPDYPTKFCGHELGSQSKFDPSEGKAIVNGSHTQQDLQLLIDKFIDKFVLCEQCKLPEIDLLLKKNRVGYRCNACGNQGQVDNRHKLATFIMKNPPDGGDSTLGTQTKKSKQEGKKDKSIKTKPKTSEGDTELLNGSGEDIKKIKKTKKIKGQTCKDGSIDCDTLSDDTDTKDPSQDTSKLTKSYIVEEKKNESDLDDGNIPSKKFLKNKKGKSKECMADIEDLHYQSPEIQSIIERLTNLVENTNQNPPTSANNTESSRLSPTDFFNELRMLQITQSFNNRVKFYIALEVFFSKNQKPLSKLLDEYIPFIKEVAQGMSNRDILTVLEDYIALNNTTSLESSFYDFPYTLQKLYNEDVLHEEGIIKHYTKTKNKDLREAYLVAKKVTEPFICWLREEGEGEEEDESEQE